VDHDRDLAHRWVHNLLALRSVTALPDVEADDEVFEVLYDW